MRGNNLRKNGYSDSVNGIFPFFFQILLNKAHEANDASSWWWNDCMMTSISGNSHWYSHCDRRTDGLTDWWTDGLSYRDALMHLVSLVNLLWHLFARKYWFPLFFTKAWPTDRPTNGPTDGQTDGPTDRRTDRRTDGRTEPHIEMRGHIWKQVW